MSTQNTKQRGRAKTRKGEKSETWATRLWLSLGIKYRAYKKIRQQTKVKLQIFTH